MGDLNSDLLKKGESGAISDAGYKLPRVRNKFSLVNVIKQPTRVTALSQTLIDVSFTSDRSKVVI